MKRGILFFAAAVVLVGCTHAQHNEGLMAKYAVPEIEAEWIRNGEPIDFDGQLWYPQDRYDILLDSEVFYKGEFRGVAFFVEKIDARPYEKVFTKFGRNKFRVFRLLD